MPSQSRSVIVRSLAFICALLVIGSGSIVSKAYAVEMSPGITAVSLPKEIEATAEILGIKKEVEQIAYLKASPEQGATRAALVGLRGRVLRKIMQAVFQVQAAEDRLESEMAYAYNMQARQRRKTDRVNQCFNAFNFAQLGILYGIIEPYSRIHKQFTQSAVGTCVGSGLAISLPLFNIMYNRLFAGVSNFTPPAFLSYMIDGKPVDATNLPPLVARYLNSAPPSSGQTRREALNQAWKKRYHVDMDKVKTLAGIAEGKAQKPAVLNTRIVLLWSLFTTIQNFDKDLLTLLQHVSDFQPAPEGTVFNPARLSPGLSRGASEAACLLGITPLIEELNSLSKEPADNDRKLELHTRLLETVLAGYLDMQIARDRCQEELNYQIDVVLAQMLARRGRFLQKTYEVNFIQTGTLGACAGWSYLNHYSKAGNQIFAVENAIGLGITTLSLAATHGGWRKNETAPNSLADFFNLRAGSTHGFSPLVWNFINCPCPEAQGKTRRQYLQEVWKKYRLASTDLSKQKNLEKLASMPSCKWDTIKLVDSRIALLTSLSEQFCRLDQELLELLNQVYPASKEELSGQNTAAASLSIEADSTANLLAIKPLVSRAQNTDAQSVKLELTRALLSAFLDSSANANLLTNEIVIESQIVDEMCKYRDLATQFTNIANFYQIGILGIISDGLGLCSKSKYVL